MASLFLFSCGVPTICELSNISINSSSATTNPLPFSITGKDSDLSMVADDCPGLLLCYVEADSYVLSIDKKTITDAFKTTVSNNNKIYINPQNIIIDKSDFTLYAFQKNKEGTQSVITPSYSLNLHDYIQYPTTMLAELELVFNKDDQKFSIAGNDLYVRDVDRTDNHYIHVFAAISAEHGDFTNAYWSGLTYIGCINMNE